MVADFAHDDPLLAAFMARAGAEPDRPAFIGPDGAALTHGALLREAMDASSLLTRTGSDERRSRSIIGLCAGPSPAFVTAFIAARLARRTVALIDHGGPAAARIASCAAIGAGWLWCPEVGPPAEVEGAAAHDPDDLGDAAAIKLTSGSTGAPKGVLVSSAALAADGHNLARSIGITEADRTLAVLPLSHSYGLTVIVMSLLLRGTAIVFPGDAPPLEAARRNRATVLPSVPAWFRAVLPLSSPDEWRGSLRRLLSAGAPLAPDLARAIRAHTGLGVHVLYGASEVGGITYDRTGTAAERGTVGTPVDGVDVSSGEPDGRIVVRSAAAGSAPWPPGADSPFEGGAFRAADRGTWQDGELVLGGRVDRVLNVRGKKVDPDLVERALTDIDGVAEAALVPVEVDGGGEPVIRAVVALQGGCAIGVPDILRQLAARLAAHEVPRGVLFVEALPRTVRGKLDRAALTTIASGEAAPR